MPNYCYCTLSFEGDEQDIAEIKQAISSTDEQGNMIPLDFNKITPMPPELNISSNSDAKMIYKRDYECKPLEGYECERLKQLSPEELTNVSLLAERYHENMTNFGHHTWYEWSWEHWGTKWNALFDDTEQENDDAIVFHTAWSPPFPVIYALSCLYPSVTCILEYFEEQDPEDITTLHIKAGKLEQT